MRPEHRRLQPIDCSALVPQLQSHRLLNLRLRSVFLLEIVELGIRQCPGIASGFNYEARRSNQVLAAVPEGYFAFVKYVR
jgi:hypothetical protein